MPSTIDHILSDYSDPDESDSPLWRDLATWAFAAKIGVDLPKATVARLLDEAAKKVKRLKTAADWASAARYFQAENFHDLEGPAAARSVALAKQRSKAAPARRSSKPARKK